MYYSDQFQTIPIHYTYECYRENHTMDELDWKTVFTINYKTLVDDLNTDDVITECLSKRLLSMEEKGEVDCQGTSHQKNDKLLTILYKKFCCNPSLFPSFTEVLSNCQSSEHLVQNLSKVNVDDCDTVHTLAMNKMKNIYRKTFHYAERKVNHLNIDSLIPALVSAGVLDMDTKESIRNECDHKARMLVTCIYEKGFEGYSNFIAILLEFGNKAEIFLGQALCDVELWSPKLDQECLPSCPCTYVNSKDI